MKQVDISDINNYKTCCKKDYSIYACIPESDTIIINRFSNPDLYVKLGRKDFFTAEQVHKQNLLQKYADYIQKGQIQVVKDSCVCLYGTVGELKLLSIREFVNTYTFADNQQITSQNIDRLEDNWCVVLPIKPILDVIYSACFVPKSQTNIVEYFYDSVRFSHSEKLRCNNPLLEHGKGDFIVCKTKANGKPDLFSKILVNGNVFAMTFNNRRFADCLGSVSKYERVNINTLPKICEKSYKAEEKYVLDKNIFEQKCNTFMKELMKVCKFKVLHYKTEEKTYARISTYELFKPCYIATYEISGNFLFKQETSFDKTLIKMICDKGRSTSALVCGITPNLEYATTYLFTIPSNARCLDNDYVCQSKYIASMNCLEEVKTFCKRTPSEYLDLIRNHKETVKQKEDYEIMADSLFDRFKKLDYSLTNKSVEYDTVKFIAINERQKLYVFCFIGDGYNIVVRARTPNKEIEKECKFLGLGVSVGTSIFEMLNRHFEL